MAVLTKKEADELKIIVIDYLVHGQDLDDVSWRLKNRSTKFKTSCTDLFKSIPLKQALKDPLIIAILAASDLNPDDGKDKQALYEELIHGSSNFLELLENISKKSDDNLGFLNGNIKGNEHLGFLVKLIESTYPYQNPAWYFVFGAVIIAGLGTLLYFKQDYLNAMLDWLYTTFPTVIDWIGATFSMLRNIPLLGIIWTGIVLIWDSYFILTNNTTTTKFKLSQLFFKTLNSALITASYTLTYLAGGIITGPAATLMILGSGTVNVFTRLYILAHARKPQPLTHLQKGNWKSVAAFERETNLYQREWRSFWYELGAAILITASVIIWCVFPPSIIISLSCLFFTWLVVLARESIFANLKVQFANQLQTSLQAIDAKKSADLTPNITQEEKELAQQVKKLKKRNAYLENQILQHNGARKGKRKELVAPHLEEPDNDNASQESSPAKTVRRFGSRGQFFKKASSPQQYPFAKRQPISQRRSPTYSDDDAEENDDLRSQSSYSSYS